MGDIGKDIGDKGHVDCYGCQSLLVQHTVDFWGGKIMQNRSGWKAEFDNDDNDGGVFESLMG